MPLSSSVPKIQFTPEGVILPTDADVLAGVQIDWNYAFGGDLNPSLSTPQGQLASSQTAIISDKNSEIALVVNQVDPQYSTGRFQDAIGRIYYLDRKGAEPTVVTCVLGGLVNTTVPAGTLAQDTSGNTYTLLGDVTIPASGAVSSSWANIANGPIACPAGTLIKVYQAIPGWDTITNPSDGALGRDEETPSEFEFRRKNSVAANGHGTPQAIYGNVFKVDDVLDCFVVDNPKGFVVNYGATNYPLAAHSIFVAVVGGLDADIAQAIWDKKDSGCDYNGNTTVIVKDTSGYNFPEPTYPVTFMRPAARPVSFIVQIASSPSLPPNLTELVQAAVVARFYGTDGTSRERIGSTILAARYYGTVSSIASNVVLLGITVDGGVSVGIGIDEVPTLDASDVSVVIV